MRLAHRVFVALLVLSPTACTQGDGPVSSLLGCAEELSTGVRPIARTRDRRFLGKVQESTARCRGGEYAGLGRRVPWVDWRNYYATGDDASKSFWSFRNFRGVNGALIDLEYQRIELIKFNLFDNSGTYRALRGGPRRRATARR